MITLCASYSRAPQSGPSSMLLWMRASPLTTILVDLSSIIIFPVFKVISPMVRDGAVIIAHFLARFGALNARYAGVSTHVAFRNMTLATRNAAKELLQPFR